MQGQPGPALGRPGSPALLQTCRENRHQGLPEDRDPALQPGPEGSGSSSLYTCLLEDRVVSMLIISRINRKTRFLNFSLICSEGK